MSLFNQLISTNPSIRRAAIANRRETTFVEQKIITYLGRELMDKVAEVKEHNHTIEVLLKDGYENVPYGGETSWNYDAPKMDPNSRTFQRALEDLKDWMRGVCRCQSKLRIKPESLHHRDRLSEVCYWKVESNAERDGYSTDEAWDFERLEDAVEWIRDHPDDDHVFRGVDRSNRRVTTWLDLNDVEEVTE